jgi:hypothetical protein
VLDTSPPFDSIRFPRISIREGYICEVSVGFPKSWIAVREKKGGLGQGFESGFLDDHMASPYDGKHPLSLFQGLDDFFDHVPISVFIQFLMDGNEKTA